MTFVRASGRGSHSLFLAALHVATKNLYLGRWVEKSFVLDGGERGIKTCDQTTAVGQDFTLTAKLCAIHDIF